MKKTLKSLVAMALAVAFVIGITIPAKAEGNQDYSNVSWYDGYNLTYNEITGWALSNSNGKTETENKNTPAEFTNFYVSKTDAYYEGGKYYTTVIVELKDEVNSGLSTALRMGSVALGTSSGVNDDLQTLVGTFADWGLCNKDGKVAQTGIKALVALSTVSNVFEAYRANRFKVFYEFECDKNGNVNALAKPTFVFKTELYENHENDYINDEEFTVTSSYLTYTSNKKPVKYNMKARLFEENGMVFWFVAPDGNNY